ncbi:MAG: biopolymer transporter ExbD [Lentisphaerae bacterium]|nr:biopolymer transporter ExbD [Lentisphaerota bacterium]
MRSVKKTKQRKTPEIPVNSFSDIAFLLIVFFVVATTLHSMTGVLTDMPAGEKSEQQAQETPTVQLHDNKIKFNEKDVTVLALRDQLIKLNLHNKSDDEKIVLLEATGNVDYQTYFNAMTAISAAGGIIAIVSEKETQK